MEKPLVSVLMLVYNHERTVEKAIESVLSQDVGFDCELIISNDCSKDQSREAINKSLNTHKNSRFKVIFVDQPNNLGIGKNWRWVNEQAKGKYVAVCEGDDYWIDRNKLKVQAEFLEAHTNTGIVCGNHRIQLESGEIIEGRRVSVHSHQFNLRNIQRHNYISTCTVMFRNRLLEFQDAMSDVLIQDFVSWNVILSRCNNGYYFSNYFSVQQVLSSGSYSMKSRIVKLQSFINALEYLLIRQGIQNKVFLKKRIVYSTVQLASLMQEEGKQKESADLLKGIILRFPIFVSPSAKLKALLMLSKLKLIPKINQ